MGNHTWAKRTVQGHEQSRIC